MTTHNDESLKPIQLPKMPEMCSTVYVQGPQGGEYRTAAISHEPHCAQYSYEQMQEFAREAVRTNRRAEQPQPAPMQVDSREALPFTIDGGVLTFKDGGCRPAEETEIAMWDALASRAEQNTKESM